MLNPQGLIRERWGTGLDRAWDRLPNMEQSGQWKEHFVCEETVGAPHPPYAPFPPWQEAGRGALPMISERVAEIRGSSLDPGKVSSA